MPRFLVIQRSTVEHDLDKQPAALFKPKPLTAAGGDAKGDAKAQDAKAKSSKGDGATGAMTVTFNLGGERGREEWGIEDPAAFYKAVYGGEEVTGLGAYQVEAKSELDLYHQMVMNDKHFSLESFASCYKLWQPSEYTGGPDVGKIFCKTELVLVAAVLNQVDPAIKNQFIQSGQYAPAASSDRSWITPELAKQMWIVYNDPRALLIQPGSWATAAGFNCATPDKHMTYARILALDSIPLKSLSNPSPKS